MRTRTNRSAAEGVDDLSQAECLRLQRLLFAFLWREVVTIADRDERQLRTIRWAKRALPAKYRAALPRMRR